MPAAPEALGYRDLQRAPLQGAGPAADRYLVRDRQTAGSGRRAARPVARVSLGMAAGDPYGGPESGRPAYRTSIEQDAGQAQRRVVRKSSQDLCALPPEFGAAPPILGKRPLFERLVDYLKTRLPKP
jgi:hypothetical protein